MIAADVMRTAPPPVSVRCSLAEFLRERYDYRHHCYPVVESGRPVGLLFGADVERVPAGQLGRRLVADHARRPPEVAIVDAATDLADVVDELEAAGVHEALVLEHRRPAGILLAGEARARMEGAVR